MSEINYKSDIVEVVVKANIIELNITNSILGGTGGGGSSVSVLDDLTDVTISSAASGDYLRYNGTVWVDSTLQAADLPSSIDASKIADGTISNAEFQTLNGVSSAIQTQLDGKAASSHTHVISDVTNLQTTLDGKAASSHTHAISDVTGLQTALDGKAATSHTHSISDVTNLQTSLDGKVAGNLAITGATKTKITYDSKGLVTAGADIAASDLPTGIDAAKIGTGTVSNTEFGYLDGVTSALQTQLNAKASSSHTHALDDLSDVTITTPSTNQVLKYNGTAWVNDASPAGATNLDGLTDVTITAAATGEYLRYNGTAWVDDTIKAGDLPTAIDAAKIADGTISNTEFQYLNNVSSNIQTQLDGKVASNAGITGSTKTKITYDSKGLVTAGADANLDDLGDVVITTPTSSQILSYNGTNWVNTTPSTGGTVTSVSVVSANGLAGTVANASTTPAITLSTSITGVLKGNGTAISAAAAGTDYQAPVTLTTTGSSGAATFTSNTLNVPNYTLAGLGGFSNPMSASGDTIYGGVSGAATRLAGNITTTKQFLSQTGNGTASAAPSWSTVTKSDVGLANVENTALSTWAGSTNITTLGTIATGTWSATTIGVTKGGTGLTALGTANQLLRVNAGATALEYFTPSYLTAAITSLNGLTGSVQTITNDTNVTVTSSGTAHAIGWSGSLAVGRGGTGLTALGTANQLLRVNAGATALEYFTPSYLTANQTITLSGDVSGSGTTSIAVTINAGAVAYADIQNVAANTFLANATGTAATMQEISTARIPLFSTAITGTPSSTTYLRGDGSWSSISGSGITTLNTLTATTQTFATGTTGTDFNISSATSTHTFNIPDASATARGLITTGAQTIAGAKTFSSTPTVSTFTTAGGILYTSAAGLLTQNTGAVFTFPSGGYLLTMGVGAGSSQIIFNYGSGNGGDFTGSLTGTMQMSFGFNNTAAYGGTANASSGRMVYFYDRIDAKNIMGISTNGFIKGESTSLYTFWAERPAALVTGVKITSNGDLTMSDAKNFILGSTTGNKIGTATTQKIGFWNAAPIAQPTTAVAAATFVANTGTAVNDASTFDGYTMKQVVKALRNAGLLA